MRYWASMALLIWAGCGARSVNDEPSTIRGGFYALAGPSVLFSIDGEAWSADQVAPKDTVLLALAASDLRLVAVGSAGTIISSEDGMKWRAVEAPVSDQDLVDVTYDGERFIAVGWSWDSGGVVLSSPDGESWHLLDEQELRWHRVDCKAARCFAEAWHFGDLPDAYAFEVVGDTLERVSHEERHQPLVDALGASTILDDGEALIDVQLAVSAAIRSTQWLGNRYLALGERSDIYASSDGEDWTPIDLSPALGEERVWFTGAATNGMRTVLSGSKGSLVFSNGDSWRLARPRGDEPMVHAVRFVAGAPSATPR